MRVRSIFTDEEYNANAPIAVVGTNSAQQAFGYEDVTNEYVTVSSSGKSMKIKICGVANLDALASTLGGSSSMSNMFTSAGGDKTINCLVPALYHSYSNYRCKG